MDCVSIGLILLNVIEMAIRKQQPATHQSQKVDVTGVEMAGALNRLSTGGAQPGASFRRPMVLSFASISPQSGHTTMQSNILASSGRTAADRRSYVPVDRHRRALSGNSERTILRRSKPFSVRTYS
jgi:hypothetical protein